MQRSRQITYGRCVCQKNSKALAKRAQTAGMEFDAVVRKEILRMKDNLGDLDGVDTDKQAVSFYSQASTVDGIKEVCAMADDAEVFEVLTAVDLLRLFNVVGIPAVGPVADFPDPMTYRLDQLMPGSFISVADLSVVELAGSKLKTPGTEIEIVNAIPYFEDLTIQRFLQKHAPTTLEYICSIGMRRVLAEVPFTFAYSLCGGLWRLIQQMDTDKSELNVTTLKIMAPSYHRSLHGRFKYLVPMLQDDRDPEKSFFLSHNGITNTISPLWCLVKAGNLQHIVRIMRALYTFETFQVMRRLCRQKDAKFYVQQLDRLLGVDFKAKGTPLPERFSRPSAVHTQQLELDRAFFAELRKSLEHVKYATIIVPLFQAISHEDPLGQARAIPQISDETMSLALGLDYPFEEFLMYNIIEGFLYQSKQSRVDKDTTKSLRPDLGVRALGQQMCEEYILQRYSDDYDLRLKEMAGEERKQLCTELIQKLLETDRMNTFASLLSKGVTRGEIAFQIVNFNSQGVLELHTALLDPSQIVEKRAEKLYVFYTGEDDEELAVWNGGNMYKTDTNPVRKLLTSMNEKTIWEKIQERYQTKGSHVYRGSESQKNRHGHSNSKPSYFAFGHDMLAEYFGVVSQETWEAYQEAHPTCCGMCDAVSDLTQFKLLCDHLCAKRLRRDECLHDVAKRDAAIGAKKERKATTGRKRKGFSGQIALPRRQASAAKNANSPHMSSQGSDSDDM